MLLALTPVVAPDLHGHPVTVLPSNARRGVVCFFILNGCPNANAYAPEMNRIAKQYGPKGWAFYLVYADSYSSSAAQLQHYKEFGFAFPALRATQELRAKSKTTMSPEAAVFAPTGDLIYHGRIDNRFYALGRSRPAATTHELRRALDMIDSGKRPAQASTPVVGCYLPAK